MADLERAITEILECFHRLEHLWEPFRSPHRRVVSRHQGRSSSHHSPDGLGYLAISPRARTVAHRRASEGLALAAIAPPAGERAAAASGSLHRRLPRFPAKRRRAASSTRSLRFSRRPSRHPRRAPGWQIEQGGCGSCAQAAKSVRLPSAASAVPQFPLDRAIETLIELPA